MHPAGLGYDSTPNPQGNTTNLSLTISSGVSITNGLYGGLTRFPSETSYNTCNGYTLSVGGSGTIVEVVGDRVDQTSSEKSTDGATGDVQANSNTLYISGVNLASGAVIDGEPSIYRRNCLIIWRQHLWRLCAIRK